MSAKKINPDDYSRADLEGFAKTAGVEVKTSMSKGDIAAALDGAGFAPPDQTTDDARPTAEAVFGDAPAAEGNAFDTSAYQPKGDDEPIYGDARTRKLVTPHGVAVDDGTSVNRPDDNRDKGDK